MTKQITVFGTCRVFKPLQYLQSEKKIKINNGQFFNYTHCLPEILQEQGVLSRSYVYPPALDIFFFNRPLPPEDQRRYPDLSKTDMVICEISTARNYAYEGVQLQANYLNKFLVAPHAELLREWFKAASNLKPEKRVEETRRILAADHSLTDLEIDIIQKVKVRNMTEPEVRADILALRDAVGVPLVLVTHCDVIGKGDKRIQARVDLIESIAKIGQEENIPVYRPSELIEQHGQSVALDGDGADVNHYHPDFNPVVGEDLYQKFIA